MPNTLTFLATFPAIQSAIKIGTDGMRLQLDVPESEMANAIELLAMRGKVLRVTVELEQESKTASEAGESKPRLTRFAQ